MDARDVRTWRSPAGIAIVLIACAATGRALASPDLDMERRIEAQRAIEQVYWRHRIWPEANPGPKPPLSAVMSDDAIRAKVERYLEASNTLEQWWEQPITAEQLQAELDRMARSTRNGQVLRELYAALDDDPFLIAETLARQTLAERVLRDRYATDRRFHAVVEQQARAATAAIRSVEQMTSQDGYSVETRHLVQDGRQAGEAPPDVVELGRDEWDTWTARLARRFDASWDAIPLRQPSALREESDRFVLSAVLSAGPTEAVVASVVWPKRSFEAWSQNQIVSIESDVTLPHATYTAEAPQRGACEDDTWEYRFYVPAARERHTAVWTGTEMIVWGGYNDFTTNTGGRYDPATDSWTAVSVSDGVPSARVDHTAVWTGTEMIVWGGYENPDETRTGGRYDPVTDRWTATSIAPGVPAKRQDHTAIWTGSEMIVWGGQSGSSFLTTGGRYDPDADVWTSTSTGSGVPAKRSRHTAVWTGTEMIVWGGYFATSELRDTGGRYHPPTNSWIATSIGAGTPVGRADHSAVWTGSEMIVWGGSGGGGDQQTGGRYDPATDSWSETSTGSWVASPRRRPTAVWSGSEMIVWGGVGSSGVLNTGSRYRPATDTWYPTSTPLNLPAGRDFHTAVWTGTEMIVWGGTDDDVYLDTGGRFLDTNQTWTPTSTGGSVPSGRRSPAAVWTGAEMIVWGGYDETDLITGGRYDPATDTWTATSTGANVPSKRRWFTAVWSGTEMIVWGGYAGNRLSTGGRYDPATDGWTPTSVDGAAAARWNHTAVWSGTEMIVWGGSTGPLTNTGGRYDPSADSWTATSTGADNPGNRSGHSAVWTGTEMIIWGGGFTEIGTGSRYDPSTDSWTATSTGANVPDDRSGHSALWTGAEMIVWGGGDGGPLNTGGRYIPSTDAWSAISTGTNVPLPHGGPTAVWTGEEMIVWGGSEANRGVNTGGRYNLLTDSWTATSTGLNVPPGRFRHAAVWTGTAMLVWGSHDLDSAVGIYCAAACLETPDADGDGTGDSCDCEPTNPAVHPDAAEVCDAQDNDCNLLTDDDDPGVTGQQTWYRDFDGDDAGDPNDAMTTCFPPFGYVASPSDCNDADPTIWAVPGEALQLLFGADRVTLSWSAPLAPGGLNGTVLYDTIRSADPADFLTDASCIEADDGSDTVAADGAVPASGELYAYLVRAENGCGVGSAGDSSAGARTSVRACGISVRNMAVPTSTRTTTAERT